MRFLPLSLVFLLSLATTAYADSTCDPVIKAFQALTRAPHFTIFEAPSDNSSQRKIQIQGRPDGIYGPSSDEKTSSFLTKKKAERKEFVDRMNETIEERWSYSGYPCTLKGEEELNDKTMTVYDHDGGRLWIGKDDGLLYQLLYNNEFSILTYGPLK